MPAEQSVADWLHGTDVHLALASDDITTALHSSLRQLMLELDIRYDISERAMKPFAGLAPTVVVNANAYYTYYDGGPDTAHKHLRVCYGREI